jgi:Lysylphosphatidylglycerol synthase TM region
MPLAARACTRRPSGSSSAWCWRPRSRSRAWSRGASGPRKIVYVLAGSALGQVLVALALGASLHVVGQRARIATLLVVITLVSVIGGTVPVPGGIGVAEAGMIAGLTSAGIPQDQAVAAVFIQRLFTAYLPDLGMGHLCLDAATRIRLTRAGVRDSRWLIPADRVNDGDAFVVRRCRPARALRPRHKCLTLALFRSVRRSRRRSAWRR